RMFDFWLQFPRGEFARNSPLSNQVFNLAMAFDVQATRLFRTVAEQSRRAEAQNANIVCRPLFETVLAQLFLLEERVAILTAPITDPDTGLQKVKNGRLAFSAQIASDDSPPNSDRLLSRDQRANLYFAHAH